MYDVQQIVPFLALTVRMSENQEQWGPSRGTTATDSKVVSGRRIEWRNYRLAGQLRVGVWEIDRLGKEGELAPVGLLPRRLHCLISLLPSFSWITSILSRDEPATLVLRWPGKETMPWGNINMLLTIAMLITISSWIMMSLFNIPQNISISVEI